MLKEILHLTRDEFRLIFIFILIVSMILFSAQIYANDDEDEEEDEDPPKDLVLRGDAKCTSCHDENADKPILAIGKTKHGTVADHRTPTCTSCHGNAGNHEESPDKALMPERTFGKNSVNSIEDRNSACLACHQGGKRMHWPGSTHANRDVACTSCHKIHTEQDKVRNRATQAEVCFSCHKEVRTLVNRPYRHPIREGKVICSDCHNPHGSAGPSKMLRDNVNDTCYSCHMEKRGPFVYNHPPVQENCAICHNAHGTTAPNLLRSRSPFLCQECHEPNTHQGSSGTLTGSYARNTLARGCANCHTEVHGSNNPFNVRNESMFQR